MRQSTQALYIFSLLLVHTYIEAMDQQNAWQKPPNIPGLSTVENRKSKKGKSGKPNQQLTQNREKSRTDSTSNDKKAPVQKAEEDLLSTDNQLKIIETTCNSNTQAEVKNENNINTVVDRKSVV